MSHVKSSETKVSVANSKTELERIVKRYGAVGFGVNEDYRTGRVFVQFVLPDKPGSKAPCVPVKIPVDVYRVYCATHKTEKASREEARMSHGGEGWKGAERVAWRNLVLWVDAALSAATLGLQTISEAFFAHAVVGDGGERMIELVEQQQARLGVGVQRLLTSGSEPSHD